ncbi:unnamed protein product [Schistosoma haematobium]|nr:unnamed protein product [Schistosoma haematobium]
MLIRLIACESYKHQKLLSGIYFVVYLSIIMFAIREGFCGYYSKLIVELMNQLKLDHHVRPGITGWPFRPTMGLLSSTHPRFRLAGFEPKTYQSRV